MASPSLSMGETGSGTPAGRRPGRWGQAYARLVTELRQQRNRALSAPYDGHNRTSHAVRMRDLAARRRRRRWHRWMVTAAEEWSR